MADDFTDAYYFSNDGADVLTLFFIEEHKKMTDAQSNLENIQAKLKGEVTTLLITRHDFTVDEAEDAVTNSFRTNPDGWNENAEAKDLAKDLASGDDDD